MYWVYFVLQAYWVLELKLIREMNGMNIACVQILFRFQEELHFRKHFL